MSAYLGNPDYSIIKGYSELNGDFDTINTTVFVKEGKIVKQDENFIFCMVVERITDVAKLENFKKDSLVCLAIHTKPYEKYLFKEKTKKVVDPSPLENLIVEWLSNDGAKWLENSFSGKLSLNGSESVLAAIKENNFWKVLAEFKECEENLIKDIAIAAPGKKGYTTAKESERLADREAFIIKSCGLALSDKPTFLDAVIVLTGMKIDAPQQYETFITLLDIVL